MILKFEPDITKEYILSKVTEEQIISYYMQQPIKFNTHILSPIRKEKRPSFSFISKQNGIQWTDWGTNQSGDCFSLVQLIEQLDFKNALQKIYTDLIKDRYGLSKTFTSVDREITKRDLQISFEFQPFTSIDINYWKQYNTSLTTLAKYDVRSLKNYSYLSKENKRVQINYTYNSPIYHYHFDSKSFKIYRPFESRQYKFFYNGTAAVMQGFNQLPWFGDTLILTKSLKDVMCLDSLGFNSISFQGEGYKLTQEVYEQLIKRFPKIITIYDDDNAGRLGAEALYKQYGINCHFIPLENNVKDISDYCKVFGYQSTTTLITELLKQ